jgi:peptide/nickel transport system substrate-binding protein
MKTKLIFLTCILVLAILFASCSSATTTTSPQTTAAGTTTTMQPTQTTTKPVTSTTAATTTSNPATTTTTPAGEQPVRGGTFKVGITLPQKSDFGWPLTTDWMHMWGENWVNQEALIYVSNQGDVSPWLAESWELASDKLSMTFHLRKDVKFQDGTQFNADAAKFMFDANINAKLSVAENWVSADIIDDYTVRLNLKLYENTIFTGLSQQSMLMVSPTQVREKGIDYAKTHPIGTGPFKFVSFEQDQYLKFERNKDYWKKDAQGNQLPYLDYLEFDTFADQTTMEMALRAGVIHAMGLQNGLAMDSMKKNGFTAVGFAGGGAFLMPSAKAGTPFADLRVRQALEYAIDKKAICDATGYGYRIVNNQWVPQTHPAWNPDIPVKAYDPAKAKQLLTDAGFADGFKTTFIIQNLNTDYTLFIQADLKKVGINGDIQTLDNLAWYDAYTNGWDGLISTSFSVDPNFAGGYKSQFTPFSRFGVSMALPSGLKDAIEAAVSEPDPVKAKKLNQQCQKVIMDNETIVPLFSENYGWIYSPTVHGGDWLAGSAWQYFNPTNVWIEKSK